MSKFTLRDTFNNRDISNHRTLQAAVEASCKFSRSVRRANGANSFIPTTILCDGKRLTDEQADAMWELMAGR